MWYNTAKHYVVTLWKPYLGTCVAVSSSMVVGDYVCQRLEQNKHDHTTIHNNNNQQIQSHQSQSQSQSQSHQFILDTSRSYAMFMTGFFITSIIGHTQQRILEYYISGNSIKAIAKKMTINSLLAPFNIGLNFVCILYFKGGTADDMKSKLKNDIGPTWLTGTLYWPIVSFINFRYVHLNYRAGLGSIAGAVWNIYISRQANKTDKDDDADATVVYKTIAR